MMTMCYRTFRHGVGRSGSTSEKPTGGASGAVVGALAPNIEVYVLGEILRGLAAGAMATGVAIIGALRVSSPWFWPGVAGGTALVLWSCSRVLPAGTLCLAVGRRAASPP